MNDTNLSINEQLKGNQLKLKDKFNDIRSSYILQMIFDILRKKKSLYIIKYNKNIQNRLNISIKDYKEYSEINSPIEIEIIPISGILSKYIRINQNEEKYFHIYINNSKEEIKRNYIEKNKKIKNIKIIIDPQITSFEKLFEDCEYIKSINFKKFHRNNITDMASMFRGCSSLEKINFNDFNTSNVIHMSCMFHGCSSLKE